MEIVKTFYLCALQGNMGLLKELHKYHSININISDKDGTTALILASANNQSEVVLELLSMGANPNYVRKSGSGPLFFAAQSGFLRIMELLIEKGANVNQENKRDFGTPLLVAAQNGHTTCVNLLLNNGASVNHRLRDGATALFLAAQGGHIHTLETLIRHGADVDLYKNDLTTPLYIASQMGHHKIVRKLVEAGADVDAAREDGSTSLFKAAQKGHRLVIEALLRGGASTSLLGNGETALHMAVLFGRTRITHLLLVNGSDPLLKNKDGLTSSDLAKEAQYNDLVTVLESFENKSRLRKGKEPFTAPPSITTEFVNDDTSQSSDTTSTTDQTSGTTTSVPHFSAPTPLMHNIPYSKLYPGFMPPSTEEELLTAMKQTVKPSIVINEEIVDKQIEKPKESLSELESEVVPKYLEELPVKLEKLLAVRHSNPEIREIEELRKVLKLYAQNDFVETSEIEKCLRNSDMTHLSTNNMKPQYMKSISSSKMSTTDQWRRTTYIPPLVPPPPLPIPPQMIASNYSDKLTLLDQSTVVVGRRKMSQPNMKTFQNEK